MIRIMMVKLILVRFYGVMRLVFLDQNAVNAFNVSPGVCRQVFFIPLFTSLFQALLYGGLFGEQIALGKAGWFFYYVLHTGAWLLYLLSMSRIAKNLDREEAFYSYFVVFCWFIPLQALLTFPLLAIQFYEIGPELLQNTAFAFLIVVVYAAHWAILRTTLRLSSVAAFGFVMLYDLFTDVLPTLILKSYGLF